MFMYCITNINFKFYQIVTLLLWLFIKCHFFNPIWPRNDQLSNKNLSTDRWQSYNSNSGILLPFNFDEGACNTHMYLYRSKCAKHSQLCKWSFIWMSYIVGITPTCHVPGLLWYKQKVRLCSSMPIFSITRNCIKNKNHFIYHLYISVTAFRWGFSYFSNFVQLFFLSDYLHSNFNSLLKA